MTFDEMSKIAKRLHLDIVKEIKFLRIELELREGQYESGADENNTVKIVVLFPNHQILTINHSNFIRIDKEGPWECYDREKAAIYGYQTNEDVLALLKKMQKEKGE